MTWTLQQLAELVNGKVIGDGECSINSVSTLQDGCKGQISFLANKQYKVYLSDTKASAVIIDSRYEKQCKTNMLVVANPHSAYAKIANVLHPAKEYKPGIHKSVEVSTSCEISSDVSIDANSCIGENVVIGAGTHIGANSVIGDNVKLGKKCIIYPNVTIYSDVIVGDDCIIHSSAVIGADGFGHAFDEQDGWIKVPQIGCVVIGDKVEVGASTTIDRGAIENTVIGNGVRLDNQIQIGHNVNIGDDTVIAACTGVAGSSRVGKRCMIGGFVAIAGHITIADDVILTGTTLVSKTITEAGSYSSGISAEPTKKWRRLHARIKQLDETVIKLNKLERLK